MKKANSWLEGSKLVGMVLVGVAVIALLTYAFRWAANTVTPVKLHQPKPGITCASMASRDGVALSCWKD